MNTKNTTKKVPRLAKIVTQFATVAFHQVNTDVLTVTQLETTSSIHLAFISVALALILT